VGYIEEIINPIQHIAKSKEAGQMKTLKYVGLDVHKKFITIAIADQGRGGEVRFYGNIEYNMDKVDKFMFIFFHYHIYRPFSLVITLPKRFGVKMSYSR
jgi:hypothetical protein